MPTNLLIPLGTKNPLYKHAQGKWNWALLNIHYKQTGFQVDKGVGLLLIDLAVLDLDTLEEVYHWETEWPVLNHVPMETTSKGKHYFFLRTPLCDELGLTDDPLSRTADFKSITATGTAGVLAVCPSPGKHWVRPLYSHPLIPIPDELARALAKLRGRKKRQTLPAACSKRTAVQAGLSAGPLVPEELLRQRFFQEQQASEIEGKLQQFYLPDITSISKECDWELHTSQAAFGRL
ncbi:hypothetical protein WJX77_002028 [Trebouxia sp. C0004]